MFPYGFLRMVTADEPHEVGVARDRVGEADQRRRFRILFRGAVRAWDGVTAALAHMFYYSSTWSVLSQVFPTLVVAPRYIAGLITLGKNTRVAITVR